MSLFPNKEQRDALMARLAFFGVTKVTVRFSGSGDSGQIDDIEFEGDKGEAIELAREDQIEWTVVGKTHLGNAWKEVQSVEKLSLSKIVEELCNAASDEANVDWWNNDGGQGYLEINLQELYEGQPVIRFRVEENITTVDAHEFDYTDVEDDDDGPSPTKQD